MFKIKKKAKSSKDSNPPKWSAAYKALVLEGKIKEK